LVVAPLELPVSTQFVEDLGRKHLPLEMKKMHLYKTPWKIMMIKALGLNYQPQKNCWGKQISEARL